MKISLHLLFIPCLILVYFSKTVSSIWCYQCVSSHPGCGLFDFDIRYYWSHQCREPNDKCVKIIEQKGADLIVIRDCLSNIEGLRRDIPADHYEGCRPAAKDPLLGHYVNSSIHEIDIRRTYYDSTLYCFCDFDERCNSSIAVKSSMFFISILTVVVKLINCKLW